MSIQITPNITTFDWSPVSMSLLTLDTGSNNFGVNDSTSSFRWRWGITHDISMATNPSYSFQVINSQLGQNSNTYLLAWTGSVSASVIGVSSSTCTVIANPLLISSPTGFTGMEGSAAGTMVSVFSSSIPMTFVWTRNGTAVSIEGTQTDTSSGSFLLLSPGLYIPQNQGTYQTRATTASGSVSSNGATVNFMPLGAVIDGPLWNPYSGMYQQQRW